MKNKMKKIGLVAILIMMIVAIAFVVINASSGKKEAKVANQDSGKLTATQNVVSENEVSTENSVSKNVVNNEESIDAGNNTQESNNVADNPMISNAPKRTTTVTELKTGTKYSVDDSITKADIVVGDNYYGTQIADINLNFENYHGKTIEIEGLYFDNMPYTFVGRYSTSAVCPTCPAGYSYFEYEWNGDKEINLEDSESWIKVIGTLKEGNDATGPYYYIDASSIELEKSQGILTVSN